MKHIKWFTQRVTSIIVILIVLLVPLLIAQLVQIAHLWTLMDSLFESYRVWFWVILVLTRLLFTVMWALSCNAIVESGHKKGFFWFKPESKSWRDNEPEPIDKSGLISGYLMLTVLAVLIGELAIRIATVSVPPYMIVG